MNFLLIDLKRFDHEAPKSSFEEWIRFLRNTKDGKFEKALESQYGDERGIVRARQILREETRKTDFIAQWHKIHDAKEEGIALGKVEVPKRLLNRGMTDQEIVTLTDPSVEEIEDLRRRTNEETVKNKES